MKSLVKTQVHSIKFLEAVLNGIGAGVTVMDETGQFLLLNSTAKLLLGDASEKYDPTKWSELCGFYCSDKVTPLPDKENPFAAAMRSEVVENQVIFVRNDRMPAGVWCSINITPLSKIDSSVRGGVIIMEDITERRRLADELARSNKDLQQFAYVAAHDLQEPLRTIIGFGELLEMNMGDLLNDKAKDYLSRIRTASTRMQSLISALLTYARVDTRGKPRENCNCNELVRHVISDMSSAIKAAKAEITVDVLPTVMADRSQLSQVFQNLIANALKYRSEQQPIIKISGIGDGLINKFCVADNGIGIDMQYSERIFVIFQRLHSRTEYEGVGIGLPLCKKIVERHGGNIWIQSVPRQGTEVHFTLPT